MFFFSHVAFFVQVTDFTVISYHLHSEGKFVSKVRRKVKEKRNRAPEDA